MSQTLENIWFFQNVWKTIPTENIILWHFMSDTMSYGNITGNDCLIENVIFSASFPFQWFEILWWIAEQTFLTPISCTNVPDQIEFDFIITEIQFNIKLFGFNTAIVKRVDCVWVVFHYFELFSLADLNWNAELLSTVGSKPDLAFPGEELPSLIATSVLEIACCERSSANSVIKTLAKISKTEVATSQGSSSPRTKHHIKWHFKKTWANNVTSLIKPEHQTSTHKLKF